MNPSEAEHKKVVKEWADKAKADLESAEVLFRETRHYDKALAVAKKVIA